MKLSFMCENTELHFTHNFIITVYAFIKYISELYNFHYFYKF